MISMNADYKISPNAKETSFFLFLGGIKQAANRYDTLQKFVPEKNRMHEVWVKVSYDYTPEV